MTDKKIIGWIDCPHCGHKDGMRITADKHGAPFGFCEANCDGQLRIGGKPRRVAAFLAKYPHIAAAMQQNEAVTVTEPDTPKTENKPEPEPAQKPKRSASSFDMESL